jgi:hypothetical protein
VFIDTEGGEDDIDCARTEKIESYGELCQAVTLLTGQPRFQTIVVDTIDWGERLIFNQVASDAGKTNITEIGFGKGYAEATRKLEHLLGLFERAISAGKGVILLGHARVVRFENPETQGYDRYEIDLHKSNSGMVQEWCDEVLFASFRVYTKTEDQGFGKERTIAVGGKERFIRTNESAAAVAKNRLRLPDELPMSWAAYAQYLGGYTPPKVEELAAPIPPALAEAAEFFGGNLAGTVVNGSSKTVAA